MALPPSPPPPPPPSSKYDVVIPPADAPILPDVPDPLEDQLQAIFTPLLQLPGNMVRPRFQAEAPNQPPLGTDWAAIGPRNQVPDNSKFVEAELEDPAVPGTYIRRVHQFETFDVMISAYGPGSRQRLEQARQMLLIPQNRWGLRRAGMGVVDLGEVLNVSYQAEQELNLQKHDITIKLRRRIVRLYRIYSFDSARVELLPDSHPLPQEP